jgi:AraC-like DNA-binding protein
MAVMRSLLYHLFSAVSEGLDADRAGERVGYGNASHFTREYKRLFSAPPIRDVEQLRDGTSERVVQGVV